MDDSGHSMAMIVDGGVTRADLGQLMASGDLPSRVTPGRQHSSQVESLTVVVPAKNESESIEGLLSELRAALSAIAGLDYEVLVIDDGSSDDTGTLAQQLGARVHRHPESLGNGAAVKRGIREARGDWILLLDGDGQHPPSAIPSLLKRAEQHDMVVGSRNGSGGSIHRNFANRIYNTLASYVTNRRIPDLTSGFRVMRASVAKSYAYLLPNTFSYPTTITLAMLRGGYSVGFEPFQVRERSGKSHIRVLRDGSRFIIIILRIATFFAPLRVFGPLSLAFAAAGVGWYFYTFLTASRLTNMAVLLLTQATVIFVLGLVSEQVAALRFDRTGR